VSERLAIEVLGDGTRVELPPQGKLVVGSDPERAQLVVRGQGIDPVHCAIGRIKGGGWALRDLGSRYGTMLNGQNTESARLAIGDRIVIGSRRLEVVDADASIVEAQEPAEPVPLASPPSNGTPPLEIPGYQLERRIGRGGMGEVWLATQISLDRRVALKILDPRLAADVAFVERFQAEARAAAALNHTHVVTVHDVGQAQGHHFLSMEYMAAGCLETRVQSQGPLPWREALRVLLDAARGLEFAESRGVVHRDIKPANLMQTEAGITKIADLGLAVQVEQEEISAEGRKIYGTPHFIAPELVRGARPDSRSDLYSLGATAYRLILGHTPFEGSSPREILRRVLNDRAVPLDQRAPGTPGGVARMVDRLLSRDPGDRYPSASILIRELERLIGADGAEAVRPTAPQRSPSHLRTALIVAGLLIVVGVGVKSILSGNGDGLDPDSSASQGGPESVSAGPAPVVSGPTERDPDGATEEQPGTPGEAAGDGGDPDDDQSEQLFEARAQIAYHELGDRALTDAERVVALRALAAQYLGTDVERRALEEAQTLEDQLRSASQAEARRAAERQGVLDALRSAADLEADPPRPGRALRAMAVVPGQEAWAADPEFSAAREAITAEVLDRAVTWAEATWTRVGELEAQGGFDELEPLCNSLLVLVDLPLSQGPEPPQVTRLRELASLARSKGESLEELRAAYEERRFLEGRLTLAQGLGGAKGLENLLSDLAFEAAQELLHGTLASLEGELARARLAPLVADVEGARAAVQLLISSWSAGEWKRFAVRLPAGSSADAIRVGVPGLTVSSADGEMLVPWAEFGGRARELDNLFTSRLERDWSDEELRHIASLMRLQAVVLGVRRVGRILVPDSRATLSKRDTQELAEAFDYAGEWARRTGEGARVERERAALAEMTRALDAAEEGRWSETATALERLLTEHDDSLLVMLLSDGSDWSEE